jgi:hypothetical protein
MVRKPISYLLFAFAAIAAAHGGVGIYVGNMPTAVWAVALGIALVLFAAGVFVRDPGRFLYRKPVEIIPQTGEIPIARKPRVPIAERPFEKEHTPRTMGDIPTVQVGIAICAAAPMLQRYLKHDPPILAICCLLVGVILIFIGRAEGR